MAYEPGIIARAVRKAHVDPGTLLPEERRLLESVDPLAAASTTRALKRHRELQQLSNQTRLALVKAQAAVQQESARFGRHASRRAMAVIAQDEPEAMLLRDTRELAQGLPMALPGSSSSQESDAAEHEDKSLQRSQSGAGTSYMSPQDVYLSEAAKRRARRATKLPAHVRQSMEYHRSQAAGDRTLPLAPSAAKAVSRDGAGASAKAAVRAAVGGGPSPSDAKTSLRAAAKAMDAANSQQTAAMLASLAGQAKRQAAAMVSTAGVVNSALGEQAAVARRYCARAREEIQDMLAMRDARSLAQAQTLQVVLDELRQYTPAASELPGSLSELAVADIGLDRVRTDVQSATANVAARTQELTTIFSDTRALLDKLRDAAAAGGVTAQLKAEVQQLREAHEAASNTIESLSVNLKIAQQRMNTAIVGQRRRGQEAEAALAARAEMKEELEQITVARDEYRAAHLAASAKAERLESSTVPKTTHSAVLDRVAELEEQVESALAELQSYRERYAEADMERLQLRIAAQLHERAAQQQQQQQQQQADSASPAAASAAAQTATAVGDAAEEAALREESRAAAVQAVMSTPRGAQGAEVPLDSPLAVAVPLDSDPWALAQSAAAAVTVVNHLQGCMRTVLQHVAAAEPRLARSAVTELVPMVQSLVGDGRLELAATLRVTLPTDDGRAAEHADHDLPRTCEGWLFHPALNAAQRDQGVLPLHRVLLGADVMLRAADEDAAALSQGAAKQAADSGTHSVDSGSDSASTGASSRGSRTSRASQSSTASRASRSSRRRKSSRSTGSSLEPGNAASASARSSQPDVDQPSGAVPRRRASRAAPKRSASTRKHARPAVGSGLGAIQEEHHLSEQHESQSSDSSHASDADSADSEAGQPGPRAPAASHATRRGKPATGTSTPNLRAARTGRGSVVLTQAAASWQSPTGHAGHAPLRHSPGTASRPIIHEAPSAHQGASPGPVTTALAAQTPPDARAWVSAGVPSPASASHSYDTADLRSTTSVRSAVFDFGDALSRAEGSTGSSGTLRAASTKQAARLARRRGPPLAVSTGGDSDDDTKSVCSACTARSRASCVSVRSGQAGHHRARRGLREHSSLRTISSTASKGSGAGVGQESRSSIQTLDPSLAAAVAEVQEEVLSRPGIMALFHSNMQSAASMGLLGTGDDQGSAMLSAADGVVTPRTGHFIHSALASVHPGLSSVTLHQLVQLVTRRVAGGADADPAGGGESLEQLAGLDDAGETAGGNDSSAAAEISATSLSKCADMLQPGRETVSSMLKAVQAELGHSRRRIHELTEQLQNERGLHAVALAAVQLQAREHTQEAVAAATSAADARVAIMCQAVRRASVDSSGVDDAHAGQADADSQREVDPVVRQLLQRQIELQRELVEAAHEHSRLARRARQAEIQNSHLRDTAKDAVNAALAGAKERVALALQQQFAERWQALEDRTVKSASATMAQAAAAFQTELRKRLAEQKVQLLKLRNAADGSAAPAPVRPWAHASVQTEPTQFSARARSDHGYASHCETPPPTERSSSSASSRPAGLADSSATPALPQPAMIEQSQPAAPTTVSSVLQDFAQFVDARRRGNAAGSLQPQAPPPRFAGQHATPASRAPPQRDQPRRPGRTLHAVNRGAPNFIPGWTQPAPSVTGQPLLATLHQQTGQPTSETKLPEPQSLPGLAALRLDGAATASSSDEEGPGELAQHPGDRVLVAMAARFVPSDAAPAQSPAMQLAPGPDEPAGAHLWLDESHAQLTSQEPLRVVGSNVFRAAQDQQSVNASHDKQWQIQHIMEASRSLPSLPAHQAERWPAPPARSTAQRRSSAPSSDPGPAITVKASPGAPSLPANVLQAVATAGMLAGVVPTKLTTQITLLMQHKFLSPDTIQEAAASDGDAEPVQTARLGRAGSSAVLEDGTSPLRQSKRAASIDAGFQSDSAIVVRGKRMAKNPRAAAAAEPASQPARVAVHPTAAPWPLQARAMPAMPAVTEDKPLRLKHAQTALGILAHTHLTAAHVQCLAELLPHTPLWNTAWWRQQPTGGSVAQAIVNAVDMALSAARQGSATVDVPTAAAWREVPFLGLARSTARPSRPHSSVSDTEGMPRARHKGRLESLLADLDTATERAVVQHDIVRQRLHSAARASTVSASATSRLAGPRVRGAHVTRRLTPEEEALERAAFGRALLSKHATDIQLLTAVRAQGDAAAAALQGRHAIVQPRPHSAAAKLAAEDSSTVAAMRALSFGSEVQPRMRAVGLSQVYAGNVRPRAVQSPGSSSPLRPAPSSASLSAAPSALARMTPTRAAEMASIAADGEAPFASSREVAASSVAALALGIGSSSPGATSWLHRTAPGAIGGQDVHEGAQTTQLVAHLAEFPALQQAGSLGSTAGGAAAAALAASADMVRSSAEHVQVRTGLAMPQVSGRADTSAVTASGAGTGFSLAEREHAHLHALNKFAK